MDNSSHLDISTTPNKLQYMNYIRENFSDFTSSKPEDESNLYCSAMNNKLHYYSATKNLITKRSQLDYPTALSSAIKSPQITSFYLSELKHTLISTSSHVYLWNFLKASNQDSLYCFPVSSEVRYCAVSTVKLGVFGSSIKKLLITIDSQNKLNFYLLQYTDSNNTNENNKMSTNIIEVPSNIIKSDFNIQLDLNVAAILIKEKEIYIITTKLDIYEIEYFSSTNKLDSNINREEINNLNILQNDKTNKYLSYNIIKHTNNNLFGTLESLYSYISTPKRVKSNPKTININNKDKERKETKIVDSFIDGFNDIYILYNKNNQFYLNIYSVTKNTNIFDIFNRNKIKQLNKINITKHLKNTFPIKLSSTLINDINNKDNKVRVVIVTDKGDRLLFGYLSKPLLLGYSYSTSFSYIKTIPCNTIHTEYNVLNSTIFPEEKEERIRRLQNDAISNDKMVINNTNRDLVTITNDLFTVISNDTKQLHVYKYDIESQKNQNNTTTSSNTNSTFSTYRNRQQYNNNIKDDYTNTTHGVEIELADISNIPSSFLSFNIPNSNSLYILTIEGLLIYNINSLLTESKLKLSESFEQNNFEELFKNENYLTTLFLNVSIPNKEKNPKLFPTVSSYSNLNELHNNKENTQRDSKDNNRLLSAYNKNISFTSHDFSYSEIIGKIYSNKVIDKTNTQLKNLLGGILEGIEFNGIKDQINKKIEISFIKCLTVILKGIFKKSLFSLITNKKYSLILKEIEVNIYNLPLNYWISLPINLRILVETIKEIILILCFISDYNVRETDILYTRLTPLKNALDGLNIQEKGYLNDILFYHLITSYKSQKLLAKLFENYVYCLEQDFILYSQNNSNDNNEYNNVGRAYEVSRELGVLEKEKRIKAAKYIMEECPHLFTKNITIKNEYIIKLEECLKNTKTSELEIFNILNDIILNNNQENTFNERVIKEVMNLLIKNAVYNVCFYFILKVYQIHYNLRSINTLTVLTPFRSITNNNNSSNEKDQCDKGNESYQQELDKCLKALIKQRDYLTIIKNITSFYNITNNNPSNKTIMNDDLDMIKPIEYIFKSIFLDFKTSFEIIKLCLQKKEFSKTIQIIEQFFIKENKEKDLCVIYTELELHIKAALFRDKKASNNYKEINIKERLDLLYKANSNLSMLEHNSEFINKKEFDNGDFTFNDIKSFHQIINVKIKTAHLQQEIIGYSNNYDFMNNVYNLQKVNNLFKRCKNYLLSTDELFSIFEELGRYEGCVLIHEITNHFIYSEIEKLVEKIKSEEMKKGGLNSSYNWKWNLKKRIVGLIPRLEKEENRNVIKKVIEKYNY